MGNCLVSIHVTGCHHNSRKDDIDQMVSDFVDTLKSKHNVTAAYLISGGEYDLLDTARRFPVKDE